MTRGGSISSVSLWMAVRISAPEIPSMAAWCIFSMIAKLFSGSPSTPFSPSMT